MHQNPKCPFAHSHLVSATTPAAYDILTTHGVPSAAISATEGILVYKDGIDGTIRQVLDAEFKVQPIQYIDAVSILTSGVIGAGNGTGDTVTATAKNVRVFV